MMFILTGMGFLLLMSATLSEVPISWYLPRNWHHVKRVFVGYGVIWKLNRNMMSSIVSIIILALVAFTFDLPMILVLTLCILGIGTIPFVFLWLAQFQYYAFEFEQLTTFLQHFIAHFKSEGKVLIALEESSKFVNGEVLKIVQKSIDQLLNHGDVEASFNVITQRYPHFIVKNIQIWIAAAEMFGVLQSKDALELLEDDIDDWIEDTMLMIQNKMQTKNKIILLSGFAIVIALFNQFMLSGFLDVGTNQIYHYSIFTLLVIVMFTILMAIRLMSKRWIDQGECL